MTKLSVKGHEIELKITKTAYQRKVVQFANHIVEDLKLLGIPRDNIEIETNIIGNKKEPAKIEFWASGYYMRFSYQLAKRFVDNLYIISKVINLEVNEVLNKQKTYEEFLHTFQEQQNVKETKKELKEAKIALGVNEDETDIDTINQSYKKLARKHHPDIGGDLEEFQKVNKAHKLIKKEMGL